MDYLKRRRTTRSLSLWEFSLWVSCAYIGRVATFQSHIFNFPPGCSHSLFILLLLSFFHFSAFRHLPPWANQRTLTYNQKCSSSSPLASWPLAELASQLQVGHWDREAKCQRWGEKAAGPTFSHPLLDCSTFLMPWTCLAPLVGKIVSLLCLHV